MYYFAGALQLTSTHTEGAAAGKLNHGSLALVTAETSVSALLTEGAHLEKPLGNVTEVDARAAPVVAVTDTPTRVVRPITSSGCLDHISS